MESSTIFISFSKSFLFSKFCHCFQTNTNYILIENFIPFSDYCFQSLCAQNYSYLKCKGNSKYLLYSQVLLCEIHDNGKEVGWITSRCGKYQYHKKLTLLWTIQIQRSVKANILSISLYQKNHGFVIWRLWIIPIEHHHKKLEPREKFRQREIEGREEKELF